MKSKRYANGRRGGFTLVELLIVVGILVILAGLVLPGLDIFKLRANQGVGATNMADVSRSIQQYYAQWSTLPDRWDSLLTTTGELWVPGQPGSSDPNMAGLDPQLTGGPPTGSPTRLATTTIVGKEVYSLSRVGVLTLMDVNPAGKGLPGNRFAVPHAITDGMTVATINSGDATGRAIIAHIYPNQADANNPVPPANKKLIVVGLGPTNGMIGKTMQEAPFYSNTDSVQYYNRLLAVFELCSGGCRARLVGVLGATGDRLDTDVASYFLKPGEMW